MKCIILLIIITNLIVFNACGQLIDTSQGGEELIEHGNYLESYKHGRWVILKKNGTIVEIQRYYLGFRIGIWEKYNSNGMLKIRREYYSDTLLISNWHRTHDYLTFPKLLSNDFSNVDSAYDQNLIGSLYWEPSNELNGQLPKETEAKLDNIYGSEGDWRINHGLWLEYDEKGNLLKQGRSCDLSPNIKMKIRDYR
jgi:antitoxin component YwqK of YwqJK toxin-antitoxin module